MSDNTETDQNFPKQAWINLTINVTAIPLQPLTPRALEESFLQGYIEALHPQVSAVLKKIGIDFIKILTKKYNKSKQIQKMNENEDFFPKSARSGFKLFLSPRALLKVEYAELEKQTREAVLEAQ